jgi:chromosome segregation protein
MDPLAIEAKKSRIFSDLSQEMKNLEISLFISTINSLNIKWDEESINYNKNLIELDEIDKKILIINSQKKEYETIFYKEKENFTKLEGNNNYFNLLCGQLSNIKSMILNQKTSVGTIINMIKFSMNDVTDAFNNKKIADIKKQSENTVDKKDIERAIEKINSIFELADLFFINMKEWAMPEYTGYIKEFKKQLILKLNNIKELLASDYDLKHEKINDIPSEDEPKNKINFEARLNKLKNILEHAQSNIANLDVLMKLLINLATLAKSIETRISAKLIREEHSSNSSQSKLNRCFEELNKLNSKKTFLENEIYRSNLKKEQIKEKVKDLSIKNFDEYNMPVDYIMKNFKATENIEKCESRVREIRGELAKYRNINPNAHLEYEKVRERFEFLENQKNDLSESKKDLYKLIVELNQKIKEYFNDKFNLINENFKYYFKILFPLGEGELLLSDIDEGGDDFGINIKADIGNNKSVSLPLLSGGEKALVSVAYLFSIFAVNSSPFYIFDEIDAALDDANLERFLTLTKIFSMGRQIIMITHQKKTMEAADIIYGFTMQSTGITKIVSEKIKENYVQVG